MSFSPAFRSVCTAAAISFGIFAAQAQYAPTDLPSVNVPQTKETITVDGKLDEAAWKTAGRVVLSDPWKQTGHPLDATEVLILWNETGVYFAFLADDKEILATRVDRDERTHKDDCVEIFLSRNRDTNGESLGLEINSLGTVADYYYRDAGWTNYGWQPPTLQIIVEKAASFALGQEAKGPGWITEVGLPWEELLYALPEKYKPMKLRANFARWNYGSKGRIFTIWSDSQLEKPGPHRLDRYGYLVFEGMPTPPLPTVYPGAVGKPSPPK